jgi:hypothetical protein
VRHCKGKSKKAKGKSNGKEEGGKRLKGEEGKSIIEELMSFSLLSISPFNLLPPIFLQP